MIIHIRVDNNIITSRIIRHGMVHHAGPTNPKKSVVLK